MEILLDVHRSNNLLLLLHKTQMSYFRDVERVKWKIDTSILLFVYLEYNYNYRYEMLIFFVTVRVRKNFKTF